MIKIKDLIKEDVGRYVLYEGSAGEREMGRIKSWGKYWVFVVYKCNGEWERYYDFTAAPTNPKQLEFI